MEFMQVLRGISYNSLLLSNLLSSKSQFILYQSLLNNLSSPLAFPVELVTTPPCLLIQHHQAPVTL